jgi:hypothetical protein
MTVPESEEVRQERAQRAAFDALDAKFGPRYFDMDGNPMSMWDWAMNYEMRVDRHIGDTYIKRRGHVYRVSTVHLGLDHSFSPYQHKPVIVETMVFQDGDMGGLDYCVRYSTKEEARRGHEEAVRYTKRHLARMVRHRPRQLIRNGGKP